MSALDRERLELLAVERAHTMSRFALSWRDALVMLEERLVVDLVAMGM